MQHYNVLAGWGEPMKPHLDSGKGERVILVPEICLVPHVNLPCHRPGQNTIAKP